MGSQTIGTETRQQSLSSVHPISEQESLGLTTHSFCDRRRPLRTFSSRTAASHQLCTKTEPISLLPETVNHTGIASSKQDVPVHIDLPCIGMRTIYRDHFSGLRVNQTDDLYPIEPGGGSYRPLPVKNIHNFLKIHITTPCLVSFPKTN